jgi:hypothetical protein
VPYVICSKGQIWAWHVYLCNSYLLHFYIYIRVCQLDNSDPAFSQGGLNFFNLPSQLNFHYLLFQIQKIKATLEYAVVEMTPTNVHSSPRSLKYALD